MLPAAPPLSIAQIVAEFGIAVPAVFPRDFYGKGGAPAAGALSFADFLGRSNVAFNSPPGDYTFADVDHVEFAITCTVNAVWTWNRTSGNGGASPPSGQAGGAWTGACDSLPASGFSGTQPNSTTFTVNASVNGVNYGPWHVTLNCSGGGQV